MDPFSEISDDALIDLECFLNNEFMDESIMFVSVDIPHKKYSRYWFKDFFQILNEIEAKIKKDPSTIVRIIK